MNSLPENVEPSVAIGCENHRLAVGSPRIWEIRTLIERQTSGCAEPRSIRIQISHVNIWLDRLPEVREPLAIAGHTDRRGFSGAVCETYGIARRSSLTIHLHGPQVGIILIRHCFAQ